MVARCPRRRSAIAGLLLIAIALAVLSGSAVPAAFSVSPVSCAPGAQAPRGVPAAVAVACLATGGLLGRHIVLPAAPSATALVAGTAAAAAAFALAGTVLTPRAAMRAAVTSVVCDEEATDPSLFVQTNVEMGEGKKAFMLAASKAVAQCLGKPESYVAVCVQDKQDIIWGGSDDPCALCKVISLGSINLENNKALTIEVSKLLAEFQVPQNRIYVNFFDLERQNVGYNGATFAG
mmetsp:Transcript_113451/g.293792  ORF Transcript_113451/g.293792 Transcript_113451/m.293792 type:complete len:235 (-) Transcript_113451:176-880(-)